MKITGAYIDGFGIFHDQTINGLDKDIVLFYGHNETGKSTLLSFIRAVLFGFPRVNSKDPSYPPLAGGVHGGRIDFVTNGGERWSVSRKPGVGGGAVGVIGSDGSTGDKALLDQLLGGIPYEAFRNIMAFGLTELQSLDTLSGEHIASAIYGAGLGTSMMAMPRASKKIHDRMARLFLKGGSKPVLNRLVGDLEHIRKRLHDASLQSDQYDAVCDEMARIEKSVLSCRNELSIRRSEQQQYEALERLWPDWITLKESLQALTALGDPANAFPEEGLKELDRLSETRERHQTALSELTTRQKQIHSRIAALPVDETALAQAAAIGILIENRNTYLENVRKQPLLVQEKQSVNDIISRLMQRLGPSWNETAALAFDRSLFTREAIRKHQTALDALERNLAATEALLADKQSSLEQAAEARRLAEKEAADRGDLPPERNPDLVQKVKHGLDRFAEALKELGRTASTLSEAKETLILLEHAALQAPSGSKWLVAAVGGIGFAAACLVAFFGDYRNAALLMGGVAAATYAARAYRKQQRLMRQYQQNQVKRQQLRVKELQATSYRLESTISAYTNWVENLLRPAEHEYALGEALLVNIDRFLFNLTQEQHQRESVLSARSKLLEKKAAEKAAGQALGKVFTARNVLIEQYAKEKSAWATRCDHFGLSKGISPVTALEALETIEEAVETIQTRDRCSLELSRIAEEIDNYREIGKQTRMAMEWPAAADDALPRTVTELAKRLEESKLNQRETETLGRELANIEKERIAIEQSLRETETLVQNILLSAGLPDEAAFRKIGRIELKRTALLSAAETAKGNMRRISGELDTAQLETRLESLSWAEINSRKEQATGSTRELDLELSGLYSRRAELKQTLETLTTSNDIIRLRAEEADLLADMEAAALEWSRYALADLLIVHAREVFEKIHQPGILQDAGTLFSRMTGGSFQGVVAPLGENTLMAVAQNGVRISPDLLSRGTAEQLYLAVRFSYIRHQARKNDPLPVVMDDILVNFDPVRARKAAEAIVSLSASHQVLFFTCHPETTTVFQNIDPRIPIYRLDRGQITAPEKSPGSEKSEWP